jgi:hypothetical protein
MARINIMSKNFTQKDKNGRMVSLIAQFADLLNHCSTKANARLDLTKNGLVIKAMASIIKNEPVLTSYGKFSNFHYLLYYRFVEQNNPVPVLIRL